LDRHWRESKREEKRLRERKKTRNPVSKINTEEANKQWLS